MHDRVRGVHRVHARPVRSRPAQPLLRVSERRADVLQEAEQEPEEDEQQEPDHEDAENSVRHQNEKKVNVSKFVPIKKFFFSFHATRIVILLHKLLIFQLN